jgi:type 1 fimbria pilin
LHIWRDHVLKTFGAALLLASSGLAITVGPALALQAVVTQVDKNTDGSETYHFAVKLDQGETLAPGESKATADFVTI